MLTSTAETRRSFRTSNGTELTLLSSVRASEKRTNLAQLVAECDTRPEPKQVIRDVERGRPASLEQFTRAETAVVRASKPAAVLRYVTREFTALRAHLTAPCASLDETLDSEHELQCAADNQQRRLQLYVSTRDRVGIRRVIETTARHQLANDMVLQQAVCALELIDGRHAS